MNILEISLNHIEQSFLNKTKLAIDSFLEHIDIDADNATIEKLARFFLQELYINTPIFINELSEAKNKFDAIYVKGLPKFDNTRKELNCAKTISFMIGLIIGEPFQYEQQNNGDIVAQIKPVQGLEQTNSNAGKMSFGWHSDDCFLPSKFRTKWIQLTGFYNPDKILTKISLIDEIIQNLSSQSLSKLMLKNYKVKAPTSFGLGDIWSDDIPLIRVNGDNKFEIGVPTYHVIPADSEDKSAGLAFNDLMNSINKCEKSFCIESGTALIFNNDRLLHARDEIQSDRLVLRVYVKPNLDDLISATNSDNRVFDLGKLVKL
jgi:hypothetical protein